MLILICVGTLVLTAVVMLVVRAIRPQFSYYWLIASGGTILAALPLILLRFRLPSHVTLISWTSESFSTQSPTLLVDRYSWPLALSILIIFLASLLTDVNRPSRTALDTWVVGLFLTALGTLAVFSANLATLILAWVASDTLIIVCGHFRVLPEWKLKESLLASGTRILSVGVLASAILTWNHYSQMGSINNIPQQITPMLMLVAGVRIGTILAAEYSPGKPVSDVNAPSIVRVNSIAVSGILLIRVSESGISAAASVNTLVVGLFIAIIGGLHVLWTETSKIQRGLWMLGFGALSVASVSQVDPEATLSIIITSIFACGLIYLPGLPHPGWRIVYWVAAISMTALPLTPLYPYGSMMIETFEPLFIGFIISYIGLLYSFVSHILNRITDLKGAERWVSVIFMVGIGMLPVSHLILGLITFPGIHSSFDRWFFGVGVLIFTIAIWFMLRARNRLLEWSLDETLLRSFGEWCRRSFIGMVKAIDDGYRYVMNALESEGGILWSMVILILLITFIIRLE